MKSLLESEWRALIAARYPTATVTVDGEDDSYGEEGDLTAHTGPDMQADVVGVFTRDGYAWVGIPGNDAEDCDEFEAVWPDEE